MHDAAAVFFLCFSNLYLILSLAAIGFFCINRTMLFQCIYLCAFGIILNVALKGYFQVPLSPSLHKIGFAFPSGHMQLATLFYGWWGLHFQSWRLRFILGMILIGVAASLIHFDYHTLSDILGALFVALVLLSGYQLALKTLRTQVVILSMFLLASFIMIINYILYPSIPIHTYFAYATLTGLLIFKRSYAPPLSTGSKQTPY